MNGLPLPRRPLTCVRSCGRPWKREHGDYLRGWTTLREHTPLRSELVELSETAARMGGIYHTHTRASLRAQGLLAPWEEAVEIGRRSGIPVHLTHYRQSEQGAGSHLDYLGLVEDARADGMDVTFDCYTYPYSGTTITIGLPHWAKDGGPERLIAALRDPGDRARMVAELSRGAAGKQLADELQPAGTTRSTKAG